MATPNYVLKDDHVATCGHVRSAYQLLNNAKANQATTYTKTETDTALALKANQSTTYTKTETDTALAGKKNTGTFDAKIQHSTANSAVDCSGANQIDIKVNGSNRGYFYQPTGQATTPLGLLSTDKLQLQSQLSSTSIYGAKTLSTDGSLNTHGMYISGIEDATKNIQSTVNVSQGNANVYLSAGHVNPGTGMQDYCTLAANKSLQISGGLLPGISDKQLILYAGSQSQALPIQADGKMGYTPAANVAITEASQFASKAYVDSQVSGAGTGDFKKDGSVAMTGSLNVGSNRIINLANATTATDALNRQTGDGRYYLQTTTLNSIAVPTNSVSMNGQLLRNLAEPLGGSDAATVNYVNSRGNSGISSGYDVITNSGGAANVDTDGSFKVYHGNQLNLIVNDVSGTDTSRTKTYWENGNGLPIVIQSDQASVELNSTALVPNKPIRYTGVTQTFAGADNAELLTKSTINTQLGNYLTTANASSTYLTQSNASSTYLTQSNASSTYLSKTSATADYLRNDTSNAPLTMNLTGTFISTKTPTSNAHVVTKGYADALRPPAITNGASNTLEIDNTGIITQNASGHSAYSQTSVDANQVTEKISKRRKAFVATTLAQPMDVFVKNLTNSYGLILSSGYNDGINENLQTFPYVGAFSESDNTLYPFLQFDSVINSPVFLRRLYKDTYTMPSQINANEIMTKQEILDMFAASQRQSWIFKIKLGDLPQSQITSSMYSSSPAGVISSVTISNSASVARIQINHSDPGWDYRVFIQMYSDQISTNDNDAGAQTYWSHSPNRTSTYVLFEYNSAESNTQNIGYNVML